ncbi:MAG: hypothetical protein USCGTAYLOR_01100 [Chromatiales bacterium USCg_Taylor]|nr:MAG: hypothetical protein USCGTAYLOR_01100 [Chromatiales bacterium USCg_Taylor]
MKNPRILFLLLLQLTGSACSTLVRVPDSAYDFEAEPPIEAYARVLQKYVNDGGEVDFPALAQDRAGLDRYVAYVAHTPGSDFAGPQARLAHYLNSYNALSMYNVLELGIPETHAGWRKIRFFWLRDFVIGGTELSLYAYENEVIRKLGDPRVHFALNCSALGCPVLPRVPFTGLTLHQELERETRKFFSEERNLRIDHAEKKVYLSAILNFYTEDFTPVYAPSLIAYVSRYVADPIPEDYTVEFIDYDWTIANARRARPLATASLRPPIVSGPRASGTPRQGHFRSAPVHARW